MQVYVQKSTSTTRPRRPFIVSGGELNQRPVRLELRRVAEDRQVGRLDAGQRGVRGDAAPGALGLRRRSAP